MIRFVIVAVVVALNLLGVIVPSTALAQTARCPDGAYYSVTQEACVVKTRVEMGRQDQAAMSGPQWGPVSPANCAAASREMDQMAAKCRRLDAQQAVSDALLGQVVDGKTLEQCAFCCRNLREGMNRWHLCHQAGLAPPPDVSTANRSAERMNCSFRY